MLTLHHTDGGVTPAEGGRVRGTNSGTLWDCAILESKLTAQGVGPYHLKGMFLHRQVGPLPFVYIYHASVPSGVIYHRAATSVSSLSKFLVSFWISNMEARWEEPGPSLGDQGLGVGCPM